MQPGNDPKEIDIKVGGNTGGNITVGDNNRIVQQAAPKKPLNDRGLFLPSLRNELFTGRETELAQLAAALGGNANVVITQAITGMGGIGKSQLALEFAYRSAEDFISAHWLNLADPTQLNAGIAECGRQMGIDYDSQPEQVAETLRVWAGDGPRLLVLDNYESAADALQTLAPLNLPTLRLLITSRRADFPPELGLHSCHLEVFTPPESLAFLCKLMECTDEQIPNLQTLAETLGHLPLALHLAGHYLREEKIPPAEYLRELGEALAHESMQAEWFKEMGVASPTRHQQSLLGTFTLSWQKVEDETARTVFKLTGYLAPNTPIPLEIFEKSIFDQEAPDASNNPNGQAVALPKTKTGPLNENIPTLSIESSSPEALARKHTRVIHKAISRLKNLGLLTVKADLPQTHPLLAAYARHLDAGSTELMEKLADQLARLAKQANDQLDQSGSLSWFAPLQAHVLAAAEHAEKNNLQDVADLYGNLGYYLEKIADYAGARAADERALGIDEAAFGAEHSSIAIRVNNLGTVLRDLGDLPGARAAFERAIQIWEAALGENHPQVATGVNNLGGVLQYLGDLNGARAAFERAQRIFEQHLGENHPNVATLVNNLGSVLQDLGDPSTSSGRALLAEARAAFERALRIFEQHLGENHPNVATLVNNLGSVLQALGDLPGTRAAFERAILIWEASLGENHPQVAIGVLNLGVVLQAQGHKEQARACYVRALAIFEQFLPAGHPNIETAKRWLKGIEGLP